MAEVFGAVAAAVQLAGACLSLIELTEKIKGATATLLRYQNQFQELHALSLSISQNPLLQTDEIFSHTQSLLLFIQHISLEPLLRKGLVSRTWGLIRRDQYLSETSNSLEQRKSSLSLIISDIQARAIYDIRTDLRLLSDCNTEPLFYEPASEKPPKSGLYRMASNKSTDTMSSSKRNSSEERPSVAEILSASQQETQTGNDLALVRTLQQPNNGPQQPPNASWVDRSVEDTVKNFINGIIGGTQGLVRVYEGNIAESHVHQQNGDIVTADSQGPGGHLIYQGNKKIGHGDQINCSAVAKRVTTCADGVFVEEATSNNTGPRTVHLFQGNHHRGAGGSACVGQKEERQYNGHKPGADPKSQSGAAEQKLSQMTNEQGEEVD